MTKGFTDIAIRNLKPGPVRREIPDPAAKGLYVIVEPSGHKGFAVRYRFDGKPKKLSLGAIPLAAARKAAANALYEVEAKRDPAAAKRQAKDERKTIEANTFGAVAEQYLKLACGMKRDGDTVTFKGDKLRTADRRLADLERLVLPTLGSRPITEIKRSEIVALLDKIETGELKTADGDPIKGGPVMADRTLAIIRKIMNWYAVRSDDFKTPVVRGMERTKGKERARDRTLTDDEIRLVWSAASMPGPFPALVKFLLLTGARRDEAASMTWDEIAGSDWTLPASRNKVKVDLIRPLSAQAVGVLESQRREASRYVFSTNYRSPVSGFTKLKAKFEKASGTAGWTLHDLRRSARSLMSRAGVNSDHAERCLGHVIGGVRGVYDKHGFQPEMTHAYNALAALLERIVIPPAGNVTPLTKKKQAAR